MRLRTSWHVYNTDDDVDGLLGLLGRSEESSG
jgi:selenocysteine lyase/cysteine desulfurase